MEINAFAILGIVVLLIVAGVWFMLSPNLASVQPMPNSPFQKVYFFTQDQVRIVGNYYVPNHIKQAVLLLHMMPSTKESWDRLATALTEKDVASLAIDLRGHGESIQGPNGALNYETFNDVQHQQSTLDVQAALDWLTKQTGLSLDHISIVGASIGANLVLQAMAQHLEIKKGVALSPGLDYRGIQVKDAVSKLAADQAVLYVSSQDDDDNVAMTQQLYDATSAKKEIKIYVSAGHGTTMLEKGENLENFIGELLTR